MSGDDDRERRSWREIDRMRDGARSSDERRPRTAAERARAGAATQQYLKHIDGIFSGDKGDAKGEALSAAMRDAHGTPALADACRAYLDALGPPDQPALLSLVLDSGDPEIVLAGLEGMRVLGLSGELELSRGQRSQLRILAEDANDAVAEAAEDLLELAD